MNYAPTQNVNAPAAVSTRKKGANPIYAVAVVAALLLIIANFLPWQTFKTSFSSFEASMSGMGGYADNKVQDNSFSQYGERIFSTSDGSKFPPVGVVSFGFGVLLLGLAGLGLWLNKKGFAIALIPLGVLISGYMGFMVFAMMARAKNNSFEGGGQSATTSAGLGVYIGLIAAIAILVGGILPLVIKRK